MDLELDISIKEPGWKTALPDLEKDLQHILSHAQQELDLSALDSPMPVELSILLCNDATIMDLNKNYRDQNKPTNVLSFPSLDFVEPLVPHKGVGPVHLGDMALALGVMTREAQEMNKPLKDHFSHLVLHGFLHLLGYDHIDDDEAEVMESCEIRLLGQLGIANPYENKAF